MKTLLILILTLISFLSGYGQSAKASPEQKNKATLRGIIYFTNDTPPNKNTFPVELLTHDQKKRVAATTPRQGIFEFKDIKRGKYILKLTWTPGERCILLYRVDFTKKLKINARIIMDAECSSNNAAPRALSEIDTLPKINQ